MKIKILLKGVYLMLFGTTENMLDWQKELWRVYDRQ